MTTKTNYKLVDEKYTSKTCPVCGNYNDLLKAEKTYQYAISMCYINVLYQCAISMCYINVLYQCAICRITLDRNINGCRNIYFKSKM